MFYFAPRCTVEHDILHEFNKNRPPSQKIGVEKIGVVCNTCRPLVTDRKYCRVL